MLLAISTLAKIETHGARRRKASNNIRTDGFRLQEE